MTFLIEYDDELEEKAEEWEEGTSANYKRVKYFSFTKLFTQSYTRVYGFRGPVMVLETRFVKRRITGRGFERRNFTMIS